MSEVVYALEERGWIPKVIRRGDELLLAMGVDFDRGYDTREFTFPLTEEHLAALRASIARHLVLWCVLEKLATRAGRKDRQGKPNKAKARQAIDTVLLGTEQQAEQYVASQGLTPYELRTLIAHGGDPALIEQGYPLRALEGRVTAEGDWRAVREYTATKERAERGIHLGPVDAALLRYTNRFERGGGSVTRRPEQVPPEMLETVLALMSTAADATAGLAPTALGSEWESAVGAALRSSHPALLDEPIEAVASLLRREAPDRDWSVRTMPRLDDVAGGLALHLYDAAELALIAEVTAEPGTRPCVESVGGELFVGVDRWLPTARYQAVTEDDLLHWADQQQVSFAQLLAAGVARATNELGKHVARDGVCWISHNHLAAAVLLDPGVRATVTDPAHLPTWPKSATLVPDGDLVVAPLSRLRFVMTGSRDEAGMEAILKAADEAIAWRAGQSTLISPHPLVWRQGRWLPFDWGSEFPHLAEQIQTLTERFTALWLEEYAR